MDGMLAKPLPALSGWVAPRRQTLAALGAGLAGGRNFSEGVAGALRNLPGAQAADAEVQRMEEEDKAKKDEIARQLELRQQYSQFFADKDPDLAKLVGDGAVDIGTAYNTWKSGKKGADLIKLGQGDVLVDPANPQTPVASNPKPDDGAGAKEQFDREQGLNQQYTSTDPVKTYNTVRAGYQKVREAASLNSGAGDVSMIFAYMKMLDPTSVVREGEFATAQNTAGIPQTVLNMYNQATQGTRLGEEQRRDFIKAADQIYSSTVENLKGLNDQYSGRAQAWNVDPGHFIVQPQEFQPWEAPQAANDPLGIR